MEDFVGTTAEASQYPLVLLVEDDVLIRLSSGDVLRESGCKVVEAADGEEALGLLGAGLNPDLIISDIRMPGPTNGLKLLHVVREQYPGLPVLLASSHLPLENHDSSVVFLPKPYTPLALLAAARSLIVED
jgi:CheY-like chemotaxis protein